MRTRPAREHLGRRRRWDLAGQFYDAGLLDELVVQVGRSRSARASRCFPAGSRARRCELLSVRHMGLASRS